MPSNEDKFRLEIHRGKIYCRNGEFYSSDAEIEVMMFVDGKPSEHTYIKASATLEEIDGKYVPVVKLEQVEKGMG